jgi:hypothetical protein
VPRPFVPLADGAQAQIFYALGIGFISTRLWFVRRSGVVDSTTLQELADGLYAYTQAGILPLLSSDCVLASVVTTDWTASGGGSEFAFPASPTGGISSPSLSASVAVVVKFRSSTLPRNLFNRNYVGCIPDSVVTLNSVDTTWAEDLRSAYVGIIDAAPLWGTFPAWRWVCTSQEEGGAPRSTQFFRRTDVISVRLKTGQRRRRLLTT